MAMRERDSTLDHETSPLLGEHSNTAKPMATIPPSKNNNRPLPHNRHSFPLRAKYPHRTGLSQFWPWAPSYLAIIPVIFLAGMATGPLPALVPALISDLACTRGVPGYDGGNAPSQGHGSSDTTVFDCQGNEIKAAVARFYSVYSALNATAVFLTAGFWASLSDRLGRQRAIQFWTIGMFCGLSILVLIIHVESLPLYMFWASAACEGSAGSILSLLAISHAYAADVTPGDRTVVFGRLIASYFAGFGLGSALTSILVESVFDRVMTRAFWLPPTLIAIAAVYVAFIPESLPKLTGVPHAQLNNDSQEVTAGQDADDEESVTPTMVTDLDLAETLVDSHPATVHPHLHHHQDSDQAQSGICKSRKQKIKRFFKSFLPELLPNGLGGGQNSLPLLLLMSFFALFSIFGPMSIIPLYLINTFKWSPTKITTLFSFQGICRLVALTVVLPAIKKWSTSNGAVTNTAKQSISFGLILVLCGLMMEVVCLAIYGTTPVGEGFIVGGIVGSAGSLFYPCIRAVLSQATAAEDLGLMLGTLATFESLAAAIGPLVCGRVYAATLGTMPGAAFFIGVGCASFAVSIACYVNWTHRRS